MLIKNKKSRSLARTDSMPQTKGRKDTSMIAENTKVSQVKLIADHLVKYGSISTWEAIELYHCTRLPARISDLRKKGWPITSEIASGKNWLGHNSNFAVYRMEART